MADYDTLNEDPLGPSAAEQHDFNVDPVWGDLWNPTPNTWAPTMEPYPGYGEDASTVAYQSHGDTHNATPLSEQWGIPDEGGGSTPSTAANLLTDVRTPKGAVGPTVQVVQHEVHTYETGSEIARVRQVVVNSAIAPADLLEENPYRKRALLRILASSGTVNSQNNNLTATGVPATVTVPAGQTWTLQSISFLYTASAAVANRTPRVTVKDAGGRIIWQWVSSVNLTASQVAQVSLAPGLGYTAGGAGTPANPFTPTGALPPLVLPAGSTITADALAEDVADTITVGTVMFSTAGSGVFVSPRASGGAPAALSGWFRLNAGDNPIEVKTQQGISAVTDSTGPSVVQVYEEITRDGAQKITGIV